MNNILKNKIDFAVISIVKGANTGGDAETGIPREEDGIGRIVGVANKRRVRNYIHEQEGLPILVQANNRNTDGLLSIKSRLESDEYGLGKNIYKEPDKVIIRKACEKFIDTRSFGQIITFHNQIGITGPVSIDDARSIEEIEIINIPITKSTNLQDIKNDKKDKNSNSEDGNDKDGNNKNGNTKASDTRGTQYKVKYGVYVFTGGIYPLFAEKTGFTTDDAEMIKKAFTRLYEGDMSANRPLGSMMVKDVLWWTHSSKSGSCSSARLFNTVKFNNEGGFKILKEIDGVKLEVIEGF